MQMHDLATQLPKVGVVMATKLERLRITTIRDLLMHFPTGYHDFSRIVKIVELTPDHDGVIMGHIDSFTSRRSFRRKLTIQEAYVSDDTGSIKIVWFNQPFLEKVLREGMMFRFAGKAVVKKMELQLISPLFERADGDAVHTGRIIPLYPLTEGVTQKQMRFWMRHALDHVDSIYDFLPEEILRQEDFYTLEHAIHEIHFPSSEATQKKARERIAFNELLTLQLHAELMRRKIRALKAQPIPFDNSAIREAVEALPFELTIDQKSVLYDVLADLEKKHPAHRLVEGDVGSGKTVVALLAAHNVIAAGHQTALLAPTEILATQHFATAHKLLGRFSHTIALLTSKQRRINDERDVPRAALLEMIAQGKIDLIIGTHAVIQKDVVFHDLALSIIDEQQRFGVMQRSETKKKKLRFTPHLLSMTATPIPRSLALTLYGELDLSIIRTMPKGRKPIKTVVVPPPRRKKAYQFIQQELRKGYQVFVIFPLIEESEKLQAKAAVAEHKKLQKEVFPEWHIGLLHGRMKKEEKESVMQDFKNKKIDILVSTSVVEVGVDIPNATVMMIEDAERFGLAQLHQFRGRVGRSEAQSYCLLFSESPSASALSRLKALEESNDGFSLAEKDLELRGPGEVYGTTQSGYFSAMKVARFSDVHLIAKAQHYSKAIVANDPYLKRHLLLRQKMKDFEETVHLE